MKKGIFWCKDPAADPAELITVSVRCSASGDADESVVYSSKSGGNFNHKAEWLKLDRRITEGVPYNEFPRGRVEIRKGKATVFLHPALNTPRVLERIFTEFELMEPNGLLSVSVKVDGSAHYRCGNGAGSKRNRKRDADQIW